MSIDLKKSSLSGADLVAEYISNQRDSDDAIKFRYLAILVGSGKWSKTDVFYDGTLELVKGLFRVRGKSQKLSHLRGFAYYFSNHLVDVDTSFFPLSKVDVNSQHNASFLLREETHVIPKWPLGLFPSSLKEAKYLVYKDVIRSWDDNELMTSITNVQTLIEDTSEDHGSRSIDYFNFRTDEIFCLTDGTVVARPKS